MIQLWFTALSLVYFTNKSLNKYLKHWPIFTNFLHVGNLTTCIFTLQESEPVSNVLLVEENSQAYISQVSQNRRIDACKYNSNIDNFLKIIKSSTTLSGRNMKWDTARINMVCQIVMDSWGRDSTHYACTTAMK